MQSAPAPDVALPAVDAAFKLGASLYERRRWDAAAAALLLAARLGDQRSAVMRGVGGCARNLVAAGRRAPGRAMPRERSRGCISAIVCSVTESKLERLRQNLGERLAGEDWELVHIGDAASLAEGYQRGRLRARGDLLIFCHDDIRILSPDFSDRLRAYLAANDLIGVAGTTYSSGPDWAWSGAPHLYCWVSQPHFARQSAEAGNVTMLMGAHGPCVADAQLLDGLFLAMHAAVFDRIGFDAVNFDGFHGYDLDFSYRAHLAGIRTAICMDLCLFHESPGNFDATYRRYAQRFCAKLPQACLALDAPAPRDIPWMPMAATDGIVVQELDWLSHWLQADDADLRAQLRAATAIPRAGANGIPT